MRQLVIAALFATGVAGCMTPVPDNTMRTWEWECDLPGFGRFKAKMTETPIPPPPNPPPPPKEECEDEEEENEENPFGEPGELTLEELGDAQHTFPSYFFDEHGERFGLRVDIAGARYVDMFPGDTMQDGLNAFRLDVRVFGPETTGHVTGDVGRVFERLVREYGMVDIHIHGLADLHYDGFTNTLTGTVEYLYTSYPDGENAVTVRRQDDVLLFDAVPPPVQSEEWSGDARPVEAEH